VSRAQARLFIFCRRWWLHGVGHSQRPKMMLPIID